MARELFTIGHGTITADEFARLIREASIVSLVDVRSFPKSRRHPQFWREEMERWIPELSGSAYRWEPRLGGFRKSKNESPNIALRHPSFRGYADYMETDPFFSALTELLAPAKARTAIMCSETLWWRCHRRLIADAAVLLRAVDVRHVMHDGKLRAHLPTPGVRITGAGRLRYDVLAESEGIN
ncbi:MAG TPA: DUF488 domain-containing protein [Candidatus Eremiobacteraceae bacterium]|jgi:uncharacterized protein (DUF488 family)